MANNLAVAYGMQRRNRPKKKMASGGALEDELKRKGQMSANREMNEPTSQRLGEESSLNSAEKMSQMEKEREGRHEAGKALFAEGGMTEPSLEQAGHESRLDDMEGPSMHEMDKDRRHYMSEGGMAEPEWSDAGDLGFDMLEDKLPEDEYSKEGIINYAIGGEIVEPTSQRLGEERSLDRMERPIERNRQGQGMREERSMGKEIDPTVDSIRRKYMAMGGRASQMEDDAAGDNAIEHTNREDDLSYDLADDEMYPEMSALKDVGSAQRDRYKNRGMSPMASDHMDMVDEIRRKYMKKAYTPPRA